MSSRQIRLNRRKFIGSTLLLSVAGGCIDHNFMSDGRANWRAELSGHRLADIQAHSVQMNYPRLVGRNSRGGIHGTGPKIGICVIKTDQGAQGWGVFRGGSKHAKVLLDKYKGVAISELFDPVIGIVDDELVQLDFALHDLAGIILGIGVYEMLGAGGPAKTDCYSGMIYFDDLEQEGKVGGIDKVLSNCQQDISLGYRQLKVKIGRGKKWMEPKAGMERDIEVTRQIAKAFPEIDILVDGNDGFTPESFITYLEGVKDIDLFWIEEPFVEHYEGLMKLRKWLDANGKKTLLADGEAWPDQELLFELIGKKSLDVHLTDIQDYGFTKWRALMPKLKKLKCQSSPHAWGHMMKSVYISHMSSGMGNVVTIEGVTCKSDQVDFGSNVIRNGKLCTSKAPGFGMTLHL